MKTDNIIAEKTKKFAIRIIRLYQHLQKKNKGAIEVLFRQLLRCGTSIGANVHEAVRAQSKKDFESKMNIALKEALTVKIDNPKRLGVFCSLLDFVLHTSSKGRVVVAATPSGLQLFHKASGIR